MKQFTQRVRQIRRAFFDSRTTVVVIGLFLSVALHELFHIVIHWGAITEISLFPNHLAIMEVTSKTPVGYNVQLEEAIAYAITLTTMLITAIIVSNMHDKKDKRSFTQTVFPKNSPFQRLSPQELFELAARIKLL